jgi:hypothetical protein
VSFPVYSLRIFAHASLAPAGGKNGPVVPHGLIYVLRDIDVAETSGVSGSYMAVLNPLGGTLWLAQRNAANPDGDASWRGRQVYGTGEQVAFIAYAGTWSIMASGYQLTLP